MSRNKCSLASASLHKMDEIIGLSSDQRREMGRRGREKVEREFDQKIVIDLYLNHINKIVEP